MTEDKDWELIEKRGPPPDSRKKVPGNCNAVYNGDPDGFILRIDSFNVNPPQPTRSDTVDVSLKGYFKSDPGANAKGQFYLAFNGEPYLGNGVAPFWNEWIEMDQPGRESWDRCIEGPVTMTIKPFKVGNVPLCFLNGNYSVRFYAWKIENNQVKEILDFEVMNWFDGRKGPG